MKGPPKFAVRFLRWFCREDYLEEIEGDLTEVYGLESRKSPQRAGWKFIWSVLKYLRPGFVKSFRIFERRNAIDMYLNYFITGKRTLIKNKWYTLINVAGLALGLSSSIFIFLFVRHHLQYDNFHREPERIYRIVTEEHRDVVDYSAAVPPGFANAFKSDYSYAEIVAKLVSKRNTLVTVDKESKFKQYVIFAEPQFFDIFNFPLITGAKPDLMTPNSAVITPSAATRLFGEQDPVGKSIQIDGKEYVTVTGILRELPATTVIEGDIFVSFSLLKHYSPFLAGEVWGGISTELQCFTRLHPGQDIAEIEKSIANYVPKFRPKSKNVHHYKLQALADIHFDARYGGGINPALLWIFGFIGVFLVAVASINFINISTAQSMNRSKEVGVRKVLGSRKSNLFWQFMTETVLVTGLAFVLALVIVVSLLPYFNTTFELTLLLNDLLTPDFVVFGGALLLIIVLMSGSYPGIILARAAPLTALQGALGRAGDGLIVRKGLVVGQFVISIVLIIGTIGVSKQINYATKSDLGFDKSGVVMMSLPDQVAPEKLKSLKDRIAHLAGVEKITACFGSPAAAVNFWGTSLKFDNRAESEEFSIHAKIADADYLNAFDLKLLAGRNFFEKDTVDEVLVNEAFATKVGLSPEELLGKSLEIDGGFIKAAIVGVVNDFHDGDFHQAINPIFIAPSREQYFELAVKVNMANSFDVLSAIEKEWPTVFPGKMFEYNFLDARIDDLYRSERQFLSLTSTFSMIAVFIGCLGIYGLIVFVVAQKTKEIGIRKVLGASVRHVVVLLSKDFLGLLLIGAVIASPIGWYLVDKWLQSYAYKTEISWWIFIAATCLSAMITFLTISYQAIHAALANPVKSLRSE
jgi:putative ABC transport system permease protein